MVFARLWRVINAGGLITQPFSTEKPEFLLFYASKTDVVR